LHSTLCLQPQTFSIEEEFAAILQAEITKQIDAEIIAQIGLGDLFELGQKMRELQRSIYIEGYGQVPPKVYNGPLSLKNHVPEQEFPHVLSWRRHLGAALENWQANLRRFTPIAHWSHFMDLNKNDVFFYFEHEDDRINFLLLMR
jgi:hypothetical protein